MNQALAVYAEILGAGATGQPTGVRWLDGSLRPFHVHRWIGVADEVDERCLALLDGPVLDVGCGPGRHLHALARLGVFGLGVEISPVAVELARGRGATAIVASIFDELPGAGHWRSALLLDGNIGIGGKPVRLLRRLGALLGPRGTILAELAGPTAPTAETLVRLETPSSRSPWFPWAEVSVTDVEAPAARAGLAVARLWRDQERWFALLVRSE